MSGASAFARWKKTTTSDESKPTKLRKAKQPLTAFVIFMNDFREAFREEHLGSLVKDVAKIGAEKWKSMTEEEKKVYLTKAAQLKADVKEEEDEYYDTEDEQADDSDDAEDKEVKETDDDDNKVAQVNKRFWMTTTKHVILVLGGLVLLKWVKVVVYTNK
ncbi:unnamed protein product [Arabidopsis halleri]